MPQKHDTGKLFLRLFDKVLKPPIKIIYCKKDLFTSPFKSAV